MSLIIEAAYDDAIKMLMEVEKVSCRHNVMKATKDQLRHMILDCRILAQHHMYFSPWGQIVFGDEVIKPKSIMHKRGSK